MVVDGEKVRLSGDYQDYPAFVILNDNGSINLGRDNQVELWLDRLEWRELLEVLQEEAEDG